MASIEGKIIQFQVIHKNDEHGETIYVLTDMGHMYYYVSHGETKGWSLIY